MFNEAQPPTWPIAGAWLVTIGGSLAARLVASMILADPGGKLGIADLPQTTFNDISIHPAFNNYWARSILHTALVRMHRDAIVA